MHKTCALQASSSEKLFLLKQELATAAELVTSALKHEQLKCEAAHQAKAVWERQSQCTYIVLSTSVKLIGHAAT